jgi:hypothetical protein
MKIKEQKLILHFLKQLQTILENDKNQKLNKLFTDFFTREELIEILEHSILDRDLEEHNILTLGSDDLLELVGEDYFILSFLIEILENSITAVPKMSQTEVHRFFDKIQIDPHYLRDKPVEEWDAYDTSNYYSILFKHGKTKRVFAIFTSDVKSEDKYAVTTQPSYFFDTKKEAEKELENIIAEGKFSSEDLVIHNLWHIT